MTVLTIRASHTVAAYTPPSSQDDVQEEGLDEGMIIAIAVGASVGALLFVIIFFYGAVVYSNSLKPVMSAAHAGRFGTSPDGHRAATSGSRFNRSTNGSGWQLWKWIAFTR